MIFKKIIIVFLLATLIISGCSNKSETYTDANQFIAPNIARKWNVNHKILGDEGNISFIQYVKGYPSFDYPSIYLDNITAECFDNSIAAESHFNDYNKALPKNWKPQKIVGMNGYIIKDSTIYSANILINNCWITAQTIPYKNDFVAEMQFLIDNFGNNYNKL